MPRGSKHILVGMLLTQNGYPVLCPDEGGTWRLDLPRKYRKLIGLRVELEGIRADFDLLDVSRVEVVGKR